MVRRPDPPAPASTRRPAKPADKRQPRQRPKSCRTHRFKRSRQQQPQNPAWSSTGRQRGWKRGIPAWRATGIAVSTALVSPRSSFCLNIFILFILWLSESCSTKLTLNFSNCFFLYFVFLKNSIDFLIHLHCTPLTFNCSWTQMIRKQLNWRKGSLFLCLEYQLNQALLWNISFFCLKRIFGGFRESEQRPE